MPGAGNTPGLQELHGRLCGIARGGYLESNGYRMTPPAVDCLITLGAKDGNGVRTVAIQLLHSDGSPVERSQDIDLYVVSDTILNTPATTGGTTGFVAGAGNPGIFTLVAKKLFNITSTAAGLISGSYTDTGNEANFLAVRLPTGRFVYSALLSA